MRRTAALYHAQLHDTQVVQLVIVNVVFSLMVIIYFSFFELRELIDLIVHQPLFICRGI
jgi:hypothetical protein